MRLIRIKPALSNVERIMSFTPIDNLVIVPLCCTPEQLEAKKNQIGIIREAIKERIFL